MFGLGCVVLFLRELDDWADFPLLLAVLVPCVLLYGLGTSAGATAGPPAPWRSAFLVAGVLLAPLVFFRVLELLGGDPENGLHGTWIFLATAGLAYTASERRGAAYQALLMALALIVAWVFFWDEVLDEPSTTTFRWLLLVIGVALLALAVRERGADRAQAWELFTAAGVAGVLAGGIEGLGNVLSAVLFLVLGGQGDDGGAFWQLVLLVVSLALIVHSGLAGRRGAAYVGAVGLGLFALLAGPPVEVEFPREADDEGIAGWPLILLLAGGAALAASLPVPPDEGGSPVPAAPPPGAGEPGDAVVAEQT